MKKNLPLYMILTALLSLTLLSAEAEASVDLSLGGNVWYNWWQPSWFKGKKKDKFFDLSVAEYGFGWFNSQDSCGDLRR